MFFAKTALAMLAAASSAAAITIGVPSASSYWVQFEQNTISWTFSNSDPNPINIIVSNSNSSLLQGNFSIASSVDLSNGTFTVTNVTLLVGPGYTVNFVNTSDANQIFASSGTFEVKQNGTPPASTQTASSSSGSSTSGGGSSTASGSGAGSTSSSAALRTLGGSFDVTLPMVISAGMAVAGGLLVL